MELRHLKYFLAVAETSSFTQAAENSFVAQSALSQQIARLEAEVGTPLFTRTSRSVELTAAGELLVPLAQRVLDAAADASAELDAFAGLRRGTLRLGLIQAMACPFDTVGILDDFRRRYPDIGFRVRNTGSPEMVAMVTAGTLDLAVVGLSPAQLPDTLDHQLLVRDPLLAIVAPEHPLADATGVDIEQLVAAGQFIQFRGGTGLRRAVEATFTRAGLTAPQNFEVGQVQDMIRLAARGVGVTIVPRSAVHGPAAMNSPTDPYRVLRLSDRSAVHPISVVYNGKRIAPAAAAFLKAVQQHAKAEQAASTIASGHHSDR